MYTTEPATVKDGRVYAYMALVVYTLIIIHIMDFLTGKLLLIDGLT
jgi:hypothetical protein